MAASTGRELTEGLAVQQFCLLSKGAKGKACVALIEQAINTPNLFVFGELLDMPNVQQLGETEHAAHLALLRIFTYGTFAQYKAQQASLPPLTPATTTKLRQLSIVSLSAIHRTIPYTILLRELDLANVRELEDLIIDSIYQGVIKGKLDQKHQHLEVDYSIGRDILPSQLGQVVGALSDWVQRSDMLLALIEEKIKHADHVFEQGAQERRDFETQLEQLKATMKSFGDQNDLMQGAAEYDTPEFFDDSRRKSRSKLKGTRQRLT